MEKDKNGKGGYVFLSHSHLDIEKVRVIRNEMEREGYEPLCFYLKCLTDNSEIDDLICREIDARDWFVYIDSKNARKSEWVRNERAYIEKQKDKKIITLDLETSIKLDEFSKKLTNCMQVVLLYSSKTDKKTAKKVQDFFVKKDLRVYLEPIDFLKDKRSDEECLVLLDSSELRNSISNQEYSFDGISAVLLLDVQIDDRTFSKKYLSSVPWVYMDKDPSEIQLEQIGEIVEKNILNKYNAEEDRAKLEMDVDQLVKTYSGEHFLSPENVPDKLLRSDQIFTIIKETDLFNKTIVIRDDPQGMYQLPDFAEKNKEELMSAHISSTVYDNDNIRVKKWYTDGNDFVIETERTRYFSSLKTNRVMDYCLMNGTTIRQRFEPGPNLSKLENSQLSNHLGFNGMIESADGWFFLVFRKNNLSIGKCIYGNSINASLKTKYALDKSKVFQTKLLYYAIKKEIRDEIGFEEDGIEPTVLTAYRDALEGGKPQLFFYYKSLLTRQEIADAFAFHLKETQEGKKTELQRDRAVRTMLMDGERIVWIEKKDLMDPKKTKLYNNRIQTLILEENDTKKTEILPTLASCAGCILLLREFLQKKDDQVANS